MVSRWFSQRKYQRKIHRDHILKTLFQQWERKQKGMTYGELINQFQGKASTTKKHINSLMKGGFLLSGDNHLSLTATGFTEARRIVRLHRLWELYLSKYLNLAPDHVHAMAEKMEHIITPELEAQLDASLDYPRADPHQSTIPRDSDDI